MNIKSFLPYFVIVCCVLIALKLNNHVYTAAIMAIAYIVSIFINRANPNIVHLCCLLLLFTAIKQFLFLFIPTTAPEGEPKVWMNNTIYLTHLTLDFSLLIMLIYRGALSRAIYSKLKKPTAGLHLTFADIGLWSVIVLFICVDLYSAAENIVRNLEHVGVSMETAKKYWQTNWMFYHYSDIKRWLIGAEFLVIWLMVSKMSQREFKFGV